MGCLNSNNGFSHWFGNIHLSGPCNRSCYFCIGQHMMELDSYNTLDSWRLPGIDDFIEECRSKEVSEVYLTGTNTDPMLYKHHRELTSYLRDSLPVTVGIRTNAVSSKDVLGFYDKGSITICSFNKRIYKEMMGRGAPPSLEHLKSLKLNWENWKINVVLGPENAGKDLYATINKCRELGVQRINFREPYGQPHVGDPFVGELLLSKVHGMPTYLVDWVECTYWDVHYCEVESVNLYASGRISIDYPISRGHSENGVVKDQGNFDGGRITKQWLPILQ